MADALKTRPSHTSATMPNFVALHQTVRTYIRSSASQKLDHWGPVFQGHSSDAVWSDNCDFLLVIHSSCEPGIVCKITAAFVRVVSSESSSSWLMTGQWPRAGTWLRLCSTAVQCGAVIVLSLCDRSGRAIEWCYKTTFSWCSRQTRRQLTKWVVTA